MWQTVGVIVVWLVIVVGVAVFLVEDAQRPLVASPHDHGDLPDWP